MEALPTADAEDRGHNWNRNRLSPSVLGRTVPAGDATRRRHAPRGGTAAFPPARLSVRPSDRVIVGAVTRVEDRPRQPKFGCIRRRGTGPECVDRLRVEARG
jgi:hypothetical protein